MLATALILLLAPGCAALTVNDVATGESEAYPDLDPLRYRRRPTEVFKRASEVARKMPGWGPCLVKDKLTLHCEARTPVFGFVDDVYIWTVELGEGVTELRVRSASRVGRGDLGRNAARIRQYHAALLAKDDALYKPESGQVEIDM